jgi:hypothetical protein
MPAWIERACGVTVRRLEDDVDHALAMGELDPATLPALPEDSHHEASAADATGPAGVQIGARPRHWRERNRVRIHGPVGVIRLLRACLCTVQRRIERRAERPSSAGEAFEALLDHVLEAWSARERPVPREHRVFARDGWRCTVPGCSSYRNLHAHHVRFRSAGGGDELENLTTLCAAHHQRGVHASGRSGRIRIRGLAPGELRFEMPLATWTSGDVRLRFDTNPRPAHARSTTTANGRGGA